MKKIISLILVTMMALGLVACGGANTGSEGTENNVLKVGMECNYAPYNWSQTDDANGAVPIQNVDNMYTNGYDVQVAKSIAESMGKELQIYSYEWDSLIPAVQSGNLDMIIAGMSPTDERKEKIDFSNLYYVSNLVAITKEDALADVTTIADLDGKKIAAQSGTSHLEALAGQTTAEVSELADFSTMLIALSAGTIDGYISEEPTAMAICTEDSGYSYIPFVNNETGFNIPVEDSSIAVGVKKGSELLADINSYLDTFGEDAQKALMADMVKIAPVD
ncbi:MAG: transporter substrate-binding domain-containing protein [Ruminococcaceae bacterium]|nr:transporter substrate-binding domain-containing protein [Oscillospiraceae bacterium]